MNSSCGLNRATQDFPHHQFHEIKSESTAQTPRSSSASSSTRRRSRKDDGRFRFRTPKTPSAPCARVRRAQERSPIYEGAKKNVVAGAKCTDAAIARNPYSRWPSRPAWTPRRRCSWAVAAINRFRSWSPRRLLAASFIRSGRSATACWPRCRTLELFSVELQEEKFRLIQVSSGSVRHLTDDAIRSQPYPGVSLWASAAWRARRVDDRLRRSPGRDRHRVSPLHCPPARPFSATRQEIGKDRACIRNEN